ncbi:hypothetical protein ACP4OV_026843 [Aristida adscensionis]
MAKFAGYLVPHGESHSALETTVQGVGGPSSGGATLSSGAPGWSAFGNDGVSDLIDKLPAGMRDALLYPDLR